MDSLILIDCWGVEWSRKYSIEKAVYLHKRILRFTEKYNFKKVFATGANQFPIARNLTSRFDLLHLNEMTELLDHIGPSKVLVAGQAWQQCLHQRPISFPTLIEHGFTVCSHPQLVDSRVRETKRITGADFIRDPVVKWVLNKGIYTSSQLK